MYNAFQITAAGLAAYVFDPTTATAGPWLGTLLSEATIAGGPQTVWTTTASLDLSPFAGYSVYIVVRQAVEQDFFDVGAPRTRSAGWPVQREHAGYKPPPPHPILPQRG